jgi:hypothetical protein
MDHYSGDVLALETSGYSKDKGRTDSRDPLKPAFQFG